MQKHPILPINTLEMPLCPIQYQFIFRKSNNVVTATLNIMSKKPEIPRAPSAMNNKLNAEQTMTKIKQFQPDQKYFYSTKAIIKNKVLQEFFLIVKQQIQGLQKLHNDAAAKQNQSSKVRISHLHINTAPVNSYKQKFNDETFLLKDQETGFKFYLLKHELSMILDKSRRFRLIKNIWQIEKKHKSAWRDWWQQKGKQSLSNTQWQTEKQQKSRIINRDLHQRIETKNQYQRICFNSLQLSKLKL
ncbi:unnamed protein product [Paramecium octaurelia]|uniref:Uncharacterized protein n=1 Tax=Paramecium octaurelia TaxID=43137 RepID=A0A8S1YQA4_PAROT|nr:unnamed protein product [Paramecium octaurelia]